MFMSIMLVATSMGLAGAAMAADGVAIYKSKCAMCHGADGQGSAMGPAFKGNEFVTSGSEKVITEVILNGRNGAAKKYKNLAMGMPALKLSGSEVSAVVAHLKSLASR